MISLHPTKHVVLFSLEKKSKRDLETFGGPYPTPNISRLAEKSVKFNRMYTAAASTFMSLSSIINRRYTHEMERGLYTENYHSDNLFSEMAKKGRRSYFILSECTDPLTITRTYNGPDVQTIILPKGADKAQHMAQKIVEIIQSSSEPVCIMAHPVEEDFIDGPLDRRWRNRFEEIVYREDRAVGHLLDNLDLDDTRLLFYSDHGGLLGEHSNIFRYAFFVFEPIIHVPCLVTSAKPRVVDDVCSLIQLYDIALFNQLGFMERVYADTRYAFQANRITAVVEKDWKYVAHYSWRTAITGLQEELYDIRFDPNEHRNLLNDFALNPLRERWSTENVHDKNDRSNSFYAYHYDEALIRENLMRMRPYIADIWCEDFLFHLKKSDPSAAIQLKPFLSSITPVERMAVIGTLADQTGPEGIYKEVPGLPTLKQNINFSPIDSPDLSKLFEQGQRAAPQAPLSPS